MKRITTITLLAWLCLSAYATEITVGELTFSIDSSMAWVTGLSQEAESSPELNLVLPSTIESEGTRYRVIGIRAEAFVSRTGILSVEARWGVRYIETGAFRGCTGLTWVRLPSSVAKIDDNAFAGCTALKSVYYAGNDFPDIGVSETAFPDNSDMTLYVPMSSKRVYVEYMAQPAFNIFEDVTPSSLAYDFCGSDGSYLTVGGSDDAGVDSVREITMIGFKPTGSSGGYHPDCTDGCYDFEGIKYRFSHIAPRACMRNHNLTTISLAELPYLKTIGDAAFRECVNLTSVELRVDTIGRMAFYHADRINQLSLLEGTRVIGPMAFHGCEYLEQLNLPATIEAFDPSAVNQCSRLEAIHCSEDNQSYESLNGTLYSKGGQNLIRMPQNLPERNPVFHQNLKNVEMYGMSECQNLETVVFPYGLSTFGELAFQDCENITKLVLPSTFTLYQKTSFKGCAPIEQVFYNAKPGYFGSYSFANGVIPANRVYINYEAYKYSLGNFSDWRRQAVFNENGIQAYDMSDSLFNYHVISDTPVTINGRQYDGQVRIVHSDFTNNISGTVVIPDSVVHYGKVYAITAIGELSFGDNNGFELTGGSLLESIRAEAFRGSSVKRVDLPSVKTVSEYAFYNSKIKDARLDSVETIGDYAFANTVMERLFIPSVQTIGANAFDNADLGSDVIVPYGCRKIGNQAFAHGKYRRLLIPASVTSMGHNFCESTTTLEEMVINCPWASRSMNSFKFTGVPTSCRVLVPPAYDQAFRQHKSWNVFDIQAGSYDICPDGDHDNSPYRMNVSYYAPITYDGERYDGEARYVYHPVIKNATEFEFKKFETDSNTNRRYLITAIGDSCFAGSKFTTARLENCSALKSIGQYAFYKSRLTDPVTLPSEVSEVKHFAFAMAGRLRGLLIDSGEQPLDCSAQFFGGNHSEFICFVENKHLPYYIQQTTKWRGILTTTLPERQFSPFIKAGAKAEVFSTILPIDFTNSDIPRAYIGADYDAERNTLITSPVGQIPENTGVLLSNLTVGGRYRLLRIHPDEDIPSSPAKNLLVPITQNGTTLSANTGYYFNPTSLTFDRPEAPHSLPFGSAYLLLPEGGSEGSVRVDIFDTRPAGDLNGDSFVDVDDINILINIMLGIDNPDNYGGRANVDGKGAIDIGDINAIISSMIGK